MKTTKTKAKPSANKTKRSRNGTGHVRLRADGRWEGQYYFEGERKSCYGQTEEECQGKLNVVLGKIYRGSYMDGSMMPFYTYMHFWHEKYILVRLATHTNYADRAKTGYRPCAAAPHDHRYPPSPANCVRR